VLREEARRKEYICFFLSWAAPFRAYMNDSNLNFWGLICVPVGVSICFGLALLVWLRDELRAGPEDEEKKPR
jgi:hypothetical protein